MFRYNCYNRDLLLILLAVFYGAFIINYFDALIKPEPPGYPIFLIILEFFPFIPVLIEGDWKLFLSLGLIVSIVNDLLYTPVAVMYFGKEADILRSILAQFGYIEGGSWTANWGLFRIEVTGILMRLSLFIRVIAVVALMLSRSESCKGSFKFVY